MSVIEQVLRWLDGSPVRFWILGWLAVSGVLAMALAPARVASMKGWRHPALFAAAVLFALAAFRWPTWFYPQPLNPDEAQILAGAITLAEKPVYWKYVDGATHGPIVEFLPVIAHWLGAPINYASARIITTLLQALTILSVWGVLRTLAAERNARLAALPLLAFWSFTTWDDFIHYSTEIPGIALLGAGAWLAAVAVRKREPRWLQPALAASAGLCLGSIPFAKLQGAPLGLVTGIFALLFLWRQAGASGPRGSLLAGCCAAGALIPSLAVLAFVQLYGLWTHFHASYILGALAYTDSNTHKLIHMPVRFLHFSAIDPAFAWLFWGGLGFVLLCARHRTGERALQLGRYAAMALLVVSLYSAFQPGREVPHYLQLTLWPLSLLIGFSLAITDPPVASSQTRRFSAVFLWFMALTILPQVYQRGVSWHRFAGRLDEHLAHKPSEAARFLRDRARPDDAVALWGWEPWLLVETGLPHGTRESNSIYQVMDWPLRPYYMNRYLWDMKKHRPEWFVDAVGPGAFSMTDRAQIGHEQIPELKRIIADNYLFVGEFANLRIYRRTGR